MILYYTDNGIPLVTFLSFKRLNHVVPVEFEQSSRSDLYFRPSEKSFEHFHSLKNFCIQAFSKIRIVYRKMFVTLKF